MSFYLAGLLLLSLTANAILVFRYAYTTDSVRRDRLVNLSLAALATAWVLYGVEGVFRSWVISDGFLMTRAGQKWMREHFHPINSLGYRDVEHAATRSGREFVLVTGDSFVAGHGIRDYRDRFSNVLGDLLGPGWEVGIAAKGGFGTGDAYQAVTSYPIRPDVLILAYHTNDIDNAADSLGRRPNVYPKGPPDPIRPIVNRSYAANFFYWRFARGTMSMDSTYLQFRERAYDDPEIWAVHERELGSIVDYAREHDIEFLAILIPDLNRIEESSRYTEKVRRYLKSRDVPVVDMAERLAGRPWRDLVVNSIDLHANVEVNREMAEALLGEMRSQGWVEAGAGP